MKFNHKGFANIEKILGRNEEYDALRSHGKLHKSRNLLFGSLIWTTLGLLFMILFSYFQFKFNIANKLLSSLSDSGRFALGAFLIAAAIFVFIGVFFIYSMPVWLVFIYYILLVLVQGSLVGMMVSYYFKDFASQNSDYVLLLLIPAGTVLVMGFLGYFKIFNFNKLVPLLTFLFITILVSSLLVLFMSSSWLFALISGAAYLFYSASIGLEIYRIKQMQEDYFSLQSMTGAEYFKVTLILGTTLLISIFELIRHFIILLSLFKK